MQKIAMDDAKVLEPASTRKSNPIGVYPLSNAYEEPTTPARGSTLKRGFNGRHVSMFAIAGSIETDLLVGSGTVLARGGPRSMLIVHTAVGLLVLSPKRLYIKNTLILVLT
jgi:amino acid permease